VLVVAKSEPSRIRLRTTRRISDSGSSGDMGWLSYQTGPMPERDKIMTGRRAALSWSFPGASHC
jgi:hypothetical protein